MYFNASEGQHCRQGRMQPSKLPPAMMSMIILAQKFYMSYVQAIYTLILAHQPYLSINLLTPLMWQHNNQDQLNYIHSYYLSTHKFAPHGLSLWQASRCPSFQSAFWHFLLQYQALEQRVHLSNFFSAPVKAKNWQLNTKLSLSLTQARQTSSISKQYSAIKRTSAWSTVVVIISLLPLLVIQAGRKVM